MPRVASSYNMIVSDFMKKADVKGKGREAIKKAFKEASEAWKQSKK